MDATKHGDRGRRAERAQMMQSRRSFLHLGIAAVATLVARPASAAHPPAYHGSARGGGTVTAIDDAARTFTAARRRRAWTYHTDDNTRYRVGTEQGSWSDLKVGARVQVRWHYGGGRRVADLVAIGAPSRS